MNMYQLIFQRFIEKPIRLSRRESNLNLKIDIDVITEFKDGNSYECEEMGYYTDLDILKKDIKELYVKSCDEDNDNKSDVFNIYARVIPLNEQYGNLSGYIFFDMDGNILYEFNQDGKFTGNDSPKYKEGQPVCYIPDYGKEMQLGIISSLPLSTKEVKDRNLQDMLDGSDNSYTVLIGWELHNHVHPHERFIVPVELPKDGADYQALNDRLNKIGY